MMRALFPLLAVALVAARVQATEMIEIPTPPSPAPVVCCVVLEPRPQPRLLVAVDAGPTGRTAFGTGFAGAAVEVTLGGEVPKLSLGGRVRGDFGVTVDLPYEHVGGGGVVMARLSPRVRLGAGFLFGVLMYQRASATRASDPTVWAPTIGFDAELTIDLLRTRRDGAFFALGRLGYDYIDNLGKSSTGSSFGGGLALGYRY
jgi:hypothetical protein